MLVSEQRITVRTRGPLAPWFDAAGVTVRSMAVNARTSRSTMADLRTGKKRSIDPKTAHRIKDSLKVPFDKLFVIESSTVQRDVAPKQASR